MREDRVEVIAPRRSRARILAALRAAHPYEEPAFDVFETADFTGSRGLGRIGELPEPQTLREFTARVAAALPRTEWGVRAAGDPDRVVRTVAVCGGSGDSLLDTVSGLGADVYVTADLRHHPATSTCAEAGRPSSTWRTGPANSRGVRRPRRARRPLRKRRRWDVRVTELRTDPWTVACH